MVLRDLPAAEAVLATTEPLDRAFAREAREHRGVDAAPFRLRRGEVPPTSSHPEHSPAL